MSLDKKKYIPMIDAMLGALNETELEKVSAKRIRLSIQSLLGTDLTPFKKMFDEVLLRRYELRLKDIESSKHDPQQVQNKSGSSKKDEGHKKSTTTTKGPSAGGIKAESLAGSDANGPKDAELAAQLHSTLNKRYLRATQEAKKKGKKTSKVRKSTTEKSKPDGERALGGFAAALCETSEALAKVVGKSEVTRTEAVKKIWEYIKKHNLQDPTNKRVILCDETMGALFGPQVGAFEFNRLLSKHLVKTGRKIGDPLSTDENVSQSPSSPAT